MGYEEELEDLKKQRAVAKRKFTRKINLLRESIGNDNPDAVLRSNYEEAAKAYGEVENLNDSYIKLLYDMNAAEKTVEEADEYIVELEKKKTELHAVVEKICTKVVNVPSKIKVKALSPPTFNGDEREYPNFKSDYERLMVDTFGKDPFALKQCLSGDALKTVKGVEDNYDTMFQRLNERFGNSRRIVDVILADLKSLKPLSDGDNKGFMALVEKVEKCWLDLQKMKMQCEMNTTNVVSLIERALPNTQKREWVALADGLSDTTNIFSNLLQFLLKEKRVLEYMESTIRSSSTHSKANIHLAVSKEETESNDSDVLMNIMKNIQSSQTQLQQSVVNLTRVVSDRNSGQQQWRDSTRNNYPDKCWFHESDSHGILDCFQFNRLSNVDKIDYMRRVGICYNCMTGRHVARNCNFKKTCNVMHNDQRCGKNHHPSLHQAHVEGILFHNSLGNNQNSTTRRKALLMISKVHSNGHPVNVLWDPGSDMTIITHKMANKLGLSGKEIDLTITKVGNRTESYNSKEYTLSLTDKEGKVWTLKAYGINEITSNEGEVDITEITSLLENVSTDDIIRPVGSIDLLVGSDCCFLLPQVVKTIGNLQLMKNPFGFCLRGSHPLIKPQAINSNNICMKINHLATIDYPNDILVENRDSLKQALDKLFDVESLKATRCSKCATEFNNYTIKEEKELDMIEKGMRYDAYNRQWIAEYPWIKDPHSLPNNIPVAIARMKSTERRLARLGPRYSQTYQEQMQDMIDRKVAIKLSDREIASYDGPVHYIHHHEVRKPDSKSTPVRIVFNSSSSYMGHTLNEYWAKGPDVLNGLLAVLLRFRQEHIALVGDISKMYHTIKLDEMEQHTHRFVWRNMDITKPPEHYKLTTVTFGDRPSGAISMLALRRTAEMCIEQFPEVSKMIIKNTYVDDIVQSTTTIENALKLINDAEEVLSVGGFKIKHWVVSGKKSHSDSVKILNTEEERVLGLVWNPKDDQFRYNIKINFSKKIRKVHTGQNIRSEEIESNIPPVLTRRIILSQTASLFDPLGLVSPFTLQAKVLMRKLVTQDRIVGKDKNSVLEWDEPVSGEMREKWKIYFSELFGLESLTFERCLKPKSSIDKPMLIVFSDGSTQAYGACAYARWKLQSGSYEARLIAAKNRISPIRQLTIPLLELCGAVISCRLREIILKELDWKFDAVMHIVDSSIIRAQIQKETHGFGTFVGNRISEIQSKTDPNEWWWVSSKYNPADLLSRPTHPSNLHSNSVWQNGPEYLRLPVNEWPISQFCDEDLPDRIGVVMKCETQSSNLDVGVIDVKRFSSYSKLLRVTSRLLSFSSQRSIKGIAESPTGSSMKEAEERWIKEVQKQLPTDWMTKYQRLGPLMNNEGIITVGHRIASWLKDNWNKDCYILLPVNHPFVRLYVTHLHNIDHSGVETTLAKIQNKFWIPKARKLIKSVKALCIQFRKWSAKGEGQSWMK